MLREGINFIARVLARAAGDAADFVIGHKLASFAASVALMTAAHVLIFGERKGIFELQLAVSFVAGGLAWLLMVFAWKLIGAPYQVAQDRLAESRIVIGGVRGDTAATGSPAAEIGNAGLGSAPGVGNGDSNALGQLEELYREGEAILKSDVDGLETFLGWRERISAWNNLVLGALPKSEQFGFETIAEWPELTMASEELGPGEAVDGYVQNGLAYMHSKMIKFRKIILQISGA